VEDIAERIEHEVGSWEGVSVVEHRFGGVEFRHGRREIGHLHGRRWADIRFPKPVGDMLVETGRAQPHHVLPNTGWVSKQIRSGDDLDEAVELFRLAYERVRVAAEVSSANR
jgi:hypothetical protein